MKRIFGHVKHFTFLSFCVLLLTILSSCGQPTKESLIERMLTESTDSYTAETILSVCGIAEIEGEVIDCSVSSNFSTQISGLQNNEDIRSIHFSGNLIYKIFQENSMPIDLYVTQDETGVTTYSYQQSSDSWYTYQTEAILFNSENMYSLGKAFRDVLLTSDLQEDMEIVAGEECYVLHLNTRADALLEIAEIITDELAYQRTGIIISEEKLNALLQNVNIDLVFYLSKESGRCIKMNINLTDSDVMGLIAESGLDIGALWNFELSDVNLSSCNIEIYLSNFNETTVNLPE